MATFFLIVTLLFASEQLHKVEAFFGLNLAETMNLLNATGTVSPTKAMEDLVRERSILIVDGKALGGELLQSLLTSPLSAKQLNLVFCRKNQRVMAAQVLFSGSSSNSVEGLMQAMFELPAPLPFAEHRPAITYALRGITYSADGKWQAEPGAERVTVWNAGATEVVIQPVRNDPTLSGQIWFAGKMIVGQ